MSARILFCSKTAGPTGPTTSLGLLIDRLAQRHEVQVLFPGDGAFRDRLERKGIPYRSVSSLGRRSVPGLVGFLRKGGFDLVYVNEVSRASRHVCIAAALAGIPFVSHVRSMGWDHRWNRIAHLRIAKAVIAVSHACGDSVARYVRSGRLHVVHNGIPSDFLTNGTGPSKSGLREELGLSATTKIILCSGHISPRKGQLFALEALKQLSSSVPDVHLCFAGGLDRDREYVTRLRDRAARPDLDGRVSVLGFRSDVPELLRGADVLLHTALADPHPRAVLEGMAAGLPVVAFATDGVKETVVDGVTGYLAEPEDSAALADYLAQILLSPEEAERMGDAGRDRVKREFDAARTAERVEAIVEGVLAGSEKGDG